MLHVKAEMLAFSDTCIVVGLLAPIRHVVALAAARATARLELGLIRES